MAFRDWLCECLKMMFCFTQMLFKGAFLYRPSLCLTSRSLKNKCESARLKIISSILRPRVTAIGGSWTDRESLHQRRHDRVLLSFSRTNITSCVESSPPPHKKPQNSTPVFYTPPATSLPIHTPWAPPPAPRLHLWSWCTQLFTADADRQVALAPSHQHSSFLVG